MYSVWWVPADTEVWEYRGTTCTKVEKATLTADLILKAFRDVPLPDSVIRVQPPKHFTVVNFPTLFITDAEPFPATVRLLGRRVDLRIEPTSYLWHHGDGTQQRSSWPGKSYDGEFDPDDYIWHKYETLGVVRPSVDTTWSATYSVDGGPWVEVSGTVTQPGVATDLKVGEGWGTLSGDYH